MSYEEVRCRLAETYGVSPADVDDWTLDQIESVWRGGKRPRGIRVSSIEDVERANRDWRKLAGL